MTKPIKSKAHKPRTPPGGHPPGHNPPPTTDTTRGVFVAAVPGVVAAVDRLTAVVQKPPPLVFPPELVEALNGIATVLREHVAAMEDNTEAIRVHTKAVNGNSQAIDRNTDALEEISKIEDPPKATRITLTTAIDNPTTEETPMPPLQLHPNQKLKATFAFNGAVDGEPLIVIQGGFTAGTQDPKVEGPAPDDPAKIQTTCVAHIYCTQPASIVAGGGGTYENHPELDGRFMISLPCTATVDNPDTGTEVEKIHEPFEFVAEWIPATQAKATTISMPGLEIEP